MRRARIYDNGELAGVLIEIEFQKNYVFEYDQGYGKNGISLTMPVSQHRYEFDRFPPFFEGLLPEGAQLESLLKTNKIDRHDLLSQLIAVGADTVGVVTVEEFA